MKKLFKKSLAIVLTVIMLVTAVPLTGFKGLSELFPKAQAAEAEKPIEEFKKGDIISFGSYPQSEVKDSATLNALNNLAKDWISYGYYSGNGSYGSMVPGDWMKYCDVSYNGAKYRGVYFTKYRPNCTIYRISVVETSQNDNGYYTDTYYWFKYEPLKWRVLDPAEGFVLSESLIDSQPYQNLIYSGSNGYYNNSENTVYADDYVTSSIRKWLNDDFYNTAFTADEKSKIGTTKLDNSAYPGYPEYDSKETNDKIFLMSYNEMFNADYGFSTDRTDYDTARQAKSTDYAKSQGVYVYNSSSYYGNGYWWLRSPGPYSYCACRVDSDGWVYSSHDTSISSTGVRPAFKFNPKSGISESDNPVTGEHKKSDIFEYTAIGGGKALITACDKNASGEVTIPSEIEGLQVTEVMFGAFTGCNGVTDVIYSSGIEKADLSAFWGCDKIVNVYISDTVKEIKTTMSGQGLSNIVIDKNNNYYSSDAQGVVYNKNLTELIFYPPGRTDTSYTLPYGVRYIGEWSFDNKNIKSVTLSDSVIEIKEGAFSYCTALDSIIFSKNLSVIGNFAFRETAFKELYFPDNLISVGKEAFNNCRDLVRMVIPENTAVVSSAAFKGCNNLEFVMVNSKKCTFYDSASLPSSAVIYGHSGSKAEEYAKKYGRTFYAMSGDEIESMDKNGQQILNDLNFDIMKVLSNISFENGTIKGPEIEVLGKKVTLFEFAAATNIPILKNTSITVDDETKTIKCLIGVKDTQSATVTGAQQSTAYWSESYRDVKNMYQNVTGKKVDTTKLWNNFSKLRGNLKKINGSMGFNCDAYLAGYIELSYATGEVKYSEGGLIAELGMGATLTSRWPAFPVAYVEFGLSGSIGTELTLKYENTFIFNGNVNGSITGKFMVGLGEKNVAKTYIEGGMDAKLAASLAFPVKSMPESLKISMTGNLYVNAYGLGFELYSNSWPYADVQLYPEFKSNRSAMRRKTIAYSAAANNSTPVSRDYVTGNSKLDKNGYTFVKEDLYPYNEPQLVNLNNGRQLLVWADDDGSKSAVNRTTLFYSVFNGSAWSNPAKVSANDGYNGSPVLLSEGNKAYLVWQCAEKAANNTNMAQLAEKVDLFYSEFNGSSFSSPIRITKDNTVIEFGYSIAADSGKTYVSWIENSLNDQFMSDGVNTVKYAIIDGSSECKIYEAYKTETAIQEAVSSFANGENRIYLTCADDSNSIVLLRNFGAEPIYIGSGRVTNLQVHKNSLYFTDNSSVYKLDENTLEPSYTGLEGISNFNIVSNKNSTALVSLESSEKSTLINAAFLNGEGMFNELTAYASANGYIRNLVPLLNDNGKIQAAVNSAEYNNDSSEKLLGKTTLYILNGSNYFDLAVSGVELSSFNADTSKCTLNIDVENNGNSAVSDFSVVVTDNSNGSKQSFKLNKTVAAGQNGILTVNPTVSKPYSKRELTVTVKCNNFIDNNEANNSSTIEILHADLLLSDIKFYKDNGKLRVKGVLKNNGYDSAADVNLSVFVSVTDETVYSAAQGNLNQGELKAFDIPLSDKYLKSSVKDKIIIFKADSSAVELNYDNNMLSVVFDDITENEHFNQDTPVPPDSCIHSSVSISGKTNATCTANGEIIRKCNDCGKEFKEIIPAAGHTESDWQVVSSATCSEYGRREKLCTVCGELLETDVIEKTPHTLGDWVVTKPAEIGIEGEKTRSCTVCGKVISIKSIPALDDIEPPLTEPDNSLVDFVIDTVGDVREGEYVDVTVSLVNAGGLINGDFALSYDNSVLEYVSSEENEDMFVSSAVGLAEDGLVTCSLVYMDSCEEDSLYLFTVRFKVLETSDTVLAVTADDAYFNTDKTIQDCEFTLTSNGQTNPPTPEYTLGDVNGDSKVNSADARKALRIALKLETASGTVFLAADVNDDKKVTSQDARIILRVALKLQTF